MEYLNDVKAQSRTGALHLPLLTSRGGGPGRLTSKTMSISLADKQNGFISFKKKKSLINYIESLIITMVQMTVGYASDGIWINADKFNRTLGRERSLQTNRSSWTVPTAGHVTRDHQLGLWGLSSWSSTNLLVSITLGRFRRLRHSGQLYTNKAKTQRDCRLNSPEQQTVLTNWPLHPIFERRGFYQLIDFHEITLPSLPLLMSANRVWWNSPSFWLKRHAVRWHRALLQFRRRWSCFSNVRFKSLAQL